MELIKNEILERLAAVVGPEVRLVAGFITSPPRPELGDFAFPCFPIAKVMGKPPAAAADDLAEVLKHQLERTPARFVSSVRSAGPYLNFMVKTEALAEVVLNPHLHPPPARRGRKKVVMVEYGQPNTHKEFHVGHLRNVLVGQAVSNLLRAAGNRVVEASYIGDTGAHVAKCLWGIQKFHAREKLPKTRRVEWLGRVYAEAEAALGENPDAAAEVRAIDRSLELKMDKKLVALWRTTRAWSLAEFNAIFRELGARFRVRYYESAMEQPGQAAVDDLVRRKIATIKGGAVIVDLTSERLDEYVLRRKDGTALYATKDIALAVQKFKQFRLDESLYVVDARQSFHFKQLFRTLALAGFKQPMRHISYEFVTLPEGSMSSRTGNVVSYASFRDEVIRRARDETAKRHAEWSVKKIEATARAIAFAAIRYEMHRADAERQIVFDINRALAFDGATGPYLLYTLARINGIARNRSTNSTLKAAGELWKSPEEKQLLLALARYPEAVASAARDIKPSAIAQYLFELAKAFTAFYERCPVLVRDRTVRAARLRLLRVVALTMTAGLTVLGIKTVRMM